MKIITFNPEHNQEKMIKSTTTQHNTTQSWLKPAKIAKVCQSLPKSAKVY